MTDGSTRSPRRRDDVSTFRLYVMRGLYLLNFVLLGLNVWPHLINNGKVLSPLDGVAFSFWAALSTLSALGLRYPLKMVPLLFLQLFYKSVWLLAVAVPSGTTDMVNGFVIAVVLDILVIPWPYVLANYVTKPGDRWTLTSPSTHAGLEGVPPN